MALFAFVPLNILAMLFFSIISEREKEDQAYNLFRGLNDQYNNIKTHLLLMEHILFITIFFFLCGSIRRFTHCGRNDHTIKTYYKKHNYPIRHKLYNGKTSQVKNIVDQEDNANDKDQNNQDVGDISLSSIAISDLL